MPMRKPAAVYYDTGSRGSCLFANAWSRGCPGAQMIDFRKGYASGPAALFPSPAMYPLLREIQASDYDWYYGDHGYIDGRKHFYRITRNGYQYQGPPKEAPTDRWAGFKQHVKPWRKTGSFVLLCLNGPHHMRLHGEGALVDWAARVADELRSYTDREIRVRPKPRGKLSKIPLSMTEALKDCWCVVVYSSNAAVDALVEGVPVITLSSFAASVPMGRTQLSDVENPFFPDNRCEFLSGLADNQWNLREIGAGDAWRHMLRN